MKHLLIAKKLWEYIDDSVTEPEESADAKVKAGYKKKSSQAMSIIVLAVSDELLYLITSCTSPKQAWDTLQKHFEHDTLTNRLFLERYFRTIIDENTSIEQHI